jgi:glutamate--cysteine ligase
MNQPNTFSSSVIPTWVDASLLKGMLRGIERESLRMQSNGFLSQKNHPKALGLHSRTLILQRIIQKH